MKKRFLITVLAIILTAVLIAGCGGGSKKSDPGVTNPDRIIITAEHTANHEAATIAERYVNSYRMTVEQIKQFYSCGADIAVTSGADWITFTSTVPKDTKQNRFVRIAYKSEKGYIDLTALGTTGGKVGIDVYGDLDLSNSSNGFYVRLKTATGEVGNYKNVKAGQVLSDTILDTYVTNAVNDVYLELTLPQQGSITIKGIYLYLETEIKDFAGMAERITGGDGAAADDMYNVTNAAELNTALTAIKAKPTGPSIINIKGIITYNDWNAATGSTQKYIDIGGGVSNLSIIGEGTNGVFEGIGLKIGGSNTVIQNLTIRYVVDGDGIQINGAKYTWVDHCELYNEPTSVNPDKDKYDELLSAKNDAEYIIVSWCYFHDSWKTILVGSNDGADALPDRKMILHHNWFKDCNSRLLLYRGGHGHVYNNYYENILSTGINCRTGSKLLIENNYFKNCKDPIGFWFDDGGITGLWEVKNNKFDNCTGNQPTTSTCTLKFEGSYTYTPDLSDNVPSIVQAGVGVGKL